MRTVQMTLEDDLVKSVDQAAIHKVYRRKPLP